MDKEKIIGLFTSGNFSGGNDNKSALQDIVHTFPYFQLAQVMYARQMYEDNDSDVATRVKLASAYAPNRKAMYLMFRKPVEKKIEVANQVEVEESKYNYVFRSAEPEVIEPPQKTDSFVVTIPQTESIEPVKDEETSTVSETFLEKEILSNIAVIQNERILEEIPKLEEVQKTKETPQIAEERVEIAVNPDLGGKFSFEMWLKMLPDIKETSKIAIQDTGKKTDIIDRFLANQPRISKPKAEFFSPTKAAKVSISESDDLVSETLAKIYVQQGNFHKALKAYESLFLQNPEKSTYFAARIKEIRSLIDSGKK